MKNNSKPAPPPNVVTIKKGRAKEKYETWRYWEIVGALRWLEVEIFDAYAAARWAALAKPGETKKVGEITMEVNSSGL